MGGLSRRNKVLSGERARDLPMVVVDAGESLGPRVLHENEREQWLIKAHLIGESLALGGIDAMALGERDWSLGTEAVRRIVSQHDLPVLAANLSCDGEAPYPASKVVEAGGKTVGIVGVTLGEVSGCEVGEPVAAAAKALQTVGDVDLTVLLVPERDQGVITWGDHDLKVDFLVHARGGRVGKVPERRGGISFLQTGSEGKYLGLAELSFNKGGQSVSVGGHRELLEEEAARYRQRIGQVEARLGETTDERHRTRMEQQVGYYEQELAESEKELAGLGAVGRTHRLTLRSIALDRAISDDEETKKLVDTAKDAISNLGSPLDPGTTFVAQKRLAPADSPYAGGERCISCHRSQHVQWSSTAHSRAYNTLLRENRAGDSTCWSCHVTGAHAEGGPQAPNEVVGFHDVQCEACHGPARAHADAPGDVALRPPAQVTVETCVGCHDGEKDGGRFDKATYWPKVVHAR